MTQETPIGLTNKLSPNKGLYPPPHFYIILIHSKQYYCCLYIKMFKNSYHYQDYKTHLTNNSQDDPLKIYNRYYQRFKYYLRKSQPSNTFYDEYRKIQQKCSLNNKYANDSEYSYTWEMDLHIFMKKAWALANTWGDAGFHKSRVGERIFADGAALGAGATFA